MSTWHTRWWHSQRWGKAQLAHHCTRAVRRSQSEQSRLPTRRRVVYARASAGGTCVRRACTDLLWAHGDVFEDELSEQGRDQCMKNMHAYTQSKYMWNPQNCWLLELLTWMLQSALCARKLMSTIFFHFFSPHVFWWNIFINWRIHWSLKDHNVKVQQQHS